MKNLIICALALVSPHRPANVVGTLVTKYNIYRTDRTEHCFEEVTRIGWTVWEDELLSQIEVEMERCN